MYYISIYIVFVIILLKDILTGYPLYINLQLRYIDDIFVAYFWMIILFELVVRKNKDAFVKLVLFLLASICLLQIVQVLNGINILRYNLFFLIRDNFWYLPIAYIIIYKDKNLKKYERLIITFIVIQICAVSLQEIYSIIIDHRILFEDKVSGTFGTNGSHKLSYSLLFTLPVLIENKRKSLIWAVMTIVVLASARSAILFIILIYFLIYFIKNGISFKMAFNIIISFAVIVFMISVFNDMVETKINLNLLKQQDVELQEDTGANRVAFAYFVFNETYMENKLLTGFGPGSFASRSAITLGGHKFEEFRDLFPFKNEFISGGGSINVWLSELGILGIIIIYIYYFRIIKAAFKKPVYLYAFLLFFTGLHVQKLSEDYIPCFIFYIIVGIYFKKYHNEINPA